MYCRNCGSEIAEGSRFCNHCGNPVVEAAAPEVPEASIHTEPAVEPAAEAEESEIRRPVFDEFQWDVSEYPDRNAVEKTEEINFNWNSDPASVQEVVKKAVPETVLTGEDLEKEIFKPVEAEKAPEAMSAAERIDKFYTFNKKNEEFQKLINNEYQRVRSGNAIEHEISQADKLATERFDSRTEESSMDAFLEREGIVKPYQPKAFESDVLQRIEAQEAEREAKRLEEEARLKAIEEARLEAEAKKLAEEARIKAEEEARIRAEEARVKAEEEARIKAEEEAARLQEIARKRAEEEAYMAEQARLRAEEEARVKAEEEARIKAEEEARAKAEAEARVKAAEEARLKAEADLKAAREAAKIRAQQEARLAAEAEAQFKADQEKKRIESEEAQRELEEKRRYLAQEADQAMAQEEARRALEHTARLKAEEEAKIKAAVAGLRSGAAFAAVKNDSENDVMAAHEAARNQLSEMAKAREDFFSELDGHKPETNEAPVTGRETMLSPDDMVKTRVINKADIVAGLNEATLVAKHKSTPVAMDDDEFFDSLDMAAEEQAEPALEAQPIDFKEEKPANELEDLLVQFEETEGVREPAQEMDFFEEKPGLDDTLLMANDNQFDNIPANDFDNYGSKQPAFGAEQPAFGAEQSSFGGKQPDYDYGHEDFYEDDFFEEDLPKKELKRREKEQRQLEKARAKEEKAARKREKRDFIEEDDFDDKEEGGKSRGVLKVILVILIVILAVEVVGMGIRFLAPQSKAAEFIDNQLNKVIQLITGDDTEYNVIAAQVRTEPMEDKTDLINAQIGQNENGNIGSIVYSKDLSYDQGTDGKISDLVLSRPMTDVEWGRDKKNEPVFYDEEVVGNIIAFESKKVELMNNGDEEVLKMLDPEMPLYAEVAALKGQKTQGEFKKLEIGEIRQAGTNYYVWVRETIGDITTEKVYSMYPEKQFVMKMTACYVV